MNFNKRTIAREFAFKFLYKHLMPDFAAEKKDFIVNQNAFNTAILEFEQSYSEVDEEHPNNSLDKGARKFAEELILGAIKDEALYVSKIEPFLTNKNIDKVDRLNLSALLLGTFEIVNDKEQSPGIYINEYVNIAKKYCPPDASGFINSVLDKIAKSKV
jgi:N utilization substance protein B